MAISNIITLETIQLINLFEKITHAKVKDCFTKENQQESQLIFIVQPGNLMKSLGKNNQNIIRLKNLTKKQVKIVEFNEDPTKFVKSLIKPLTPESIELKEDTIQIKPDCTKTKGLLIGRDSKNLQALRTITKKYFPYNIQIL